MNNSLYSIISVSNLKGKTINKEETRIALLISNLFSKLSSGYYKKASTLAPVTPTVEPVKPVVPVVPEIKPVVPEVPEVKPVPSAVNTPVADNPVVVGQNPAIPAKQAEEAKTEKNYKEKTSAIDVIFLRSTKMHATDAAKKLLISKVFIQKLISHRAKSVNENKNVTPVPTATRIAPRTDPKAEAVKKYVELMKKRKEAIAQKQSYEKEMTELVNEFNITLDLVNAELARQGEKVA